MNREKVSRIGRACLYVPAPTRPTSMKDSRTVNFGQGSANITSSCIGKELVNLKIHVDTTDSQARLVASSLHRHADEAARDLFRRAHRSLVRTGCAHIP